MAPAPQIRIGPSLTLSPLLATDLDPAFRVAGRLRGPWSRQQGSGFLDPRSPQVEHHVVGLLIVTAKGPIAENRPHAGGRGGPHQVTVEPGLGLLGHRNVCKT